nr:hypothetical protein [Tanacetum cinerariifolium]
MDITIDQQVALDEALVPHASQLRISKSDFRLRSDLKSKESTLQVVYDVLKLTPFYKAFLVTTDVPEIYMQEFWATATVHYHSIRFKMNNKKHIEDFVYQVEHKDAKKSNEMYYPRFTKVIVNFFMTKDQSIPRRNKALVDAYECDKLILDTYGATLTLKRRRDDEEKDEEPSTRSNRGSKRRREGKEPESTSAPKEKTSKTSGKSTEGSKSQHKIASDLVELEFFLKEVFKATTDQLDWNNPKGQQYPHDLLKPLPLIPNSRGRHVIPFDHFINNDLEYLRSGASSQKYTTLVTKTKAADYGHIKWIEDLFYGFAVNRESTRDVYSKYRISAVTELQIFKWHNYKHLDWITVRGDDDKLYKFMEGDFKRLRIQDIKDMLLFLVQGKLTILTVDERFSFNVSLRMFTRSIVIQQRVKDLQLGVESYQKKLNLTKPDTYRSDLIRKEAYTAYSNPRGFIYQNMDKQNRLMRIDELHKFSDGTLNDVRTALDDRLKEIWMNPEEISWIKAGAEYVAESSSVTCITSDYIA